MFKDQTDLCPPSTRVKVYPAKRSMRWLISTGRNVLLWRVFQASAAVHGCFAEHACLSQQYFENLAAGASIDDLMEWFDGLDREQVRAVIEFAAHSLEKAPSYAE